MNTDTTAKTDTVAADTVAADTVAADTVAADTVAADTANREEGRLASPAHWTQAAVRRSPTRTGSPGSAQVVRPPTVPPYYLGRPAQVWLAAFRYRGSRPPA